jgi:hypothetical protein
MARASCRRSSPAGRSCDVVMREPSNPTPGAERCGQMHHVVRCRGFSQGAQRYSSLRLALRGVLLPVGTLYGTAGTLTPSITLRAFAVH